MNKLLKLLAATAAVLVVLLGAAAVAIRVFLPPDKLKALAIAQAEKTLHRRLELGSIELSVVSGLRIEGLRLSEAPDFSKGEFLRAKSFTLKPDLSALLAKKLVARTIELDGASVNVVKGKDGRFNFSDLSTASPAPSRAKAGEQAARPAAPVALSVGSLRLKDVALRYADRKQGTTVDIALSAARVDGFRPSGPFPVSLDVDAAYAAAGKRYTAALSASGSVDLGGGEPAKLVVDLPRVALSTLGKTLKASLKLEGSAAPKIALKAGSPELDAAFLDALLGPGTAPSGLAVPPLRLEASLAYAAPRLDASSFKVSAGGAELAGNASVDDLDAKEPRLRLHLSSNDIPLASLSQDAPSLKAFGLGGSAKLSLDARGTAAAPKVSGVLSLAGVSAAYRGQKLERTSARVAFTERSLDAPAATGRLDGGDFTVDLAAAGGPSPEVRLSGRLSRLDLGALQSLSSKGSSASGSASRPARGEEPSSRGPALKTSGQLVVDQIVHPNFQSGRATLSWSLTGVSEDARRLNGWAKLEIGPGRATRILDFAAQSGGLVKTLVVPLKAIDQARALRIPGFNPPDLQEIPFTRIVGDYTAADGVISVRASRLEGPVLGVAATGTVDLPRDAANLKAVTTSSLGQLELEITGPLASPSVRPNVAKAAQDVLRKTLQQQGKALLQGLFR